MSDALMGVTETSATAKAIVSELAQKYLIQESKMLPLVQNFSGLVTKGASSIKLPRSGGFTVGSKAENTSADASIITYAADTLALDQHRYVQFLLEDFASAQASVDVISDAVLKASKDLALDVDKKIIEQLYLASASAPDHLIQYTDATNEDIELADILNARKLLVDQNIDPRECFLLIGSNQERNMLKIDNFIDSSKYGSSMPIMGGEIGMIYGMKVILHTHVSTKTVAFHPTAAGFAFQSPVRVQSFYDLKELGWRYSLDYAAGFKVLDSGKRQVVIDETP